MKRLIVTIAGTLLVLAGCGRNLNEQDVLNDDIEKEVVEVESDYEEGELKEDVIESVDAMTLYRSFLGLNEESVDAICDVDLGLYDDDYNTVLECSKGEVLSFADLKKVFDSVTYGEPALYYTYFYSDTDAPVLCVLIPEDFMCIDENNCLLFFYCYNNEIHLVDTYNNRGEAYTNIYVGKDGLISSKCSVLGMSSGSLVSCYTAVVDKIGCMETLFDELIIDRIGYEYIEDDTGIGELIEEVYETSDSNVCISKVFVGDNTYYVIYTDGLDPQSDENLIQRCAEIGINLQSKSEVIPYCEEYAASLGYNIDIFALDENAVEWNSIK